MSHEQSVRLPAEQDCVTACATPAEVTARINADSLVPTIINNKDRDEVLLINAGLQYDVTKSLLDHVTGSTQVDFFKKSSLSSLIEPNGQNTVIGMRFFL